MANQKVFVSPGVYTSETDLSFVSQSVGVTTLGMVGETLKGPAFEPIFISSYDEYQTFFGGTSPEKYINTQIPKYESAYIAKSYLQQSNQLYVTRILGLSGYDAGPSWSITTIGNSEYNSIKYNNESENFIINFTGSTNNLSINLSNNSYISLAKFTGDTYQGANGVISTFYDDLKSFANDVYLNKSLSAQTQYYGSIPAVDYDINISSPFTSGITYNYYNTIIPLNFNGTPQSQNFPWEYSTFTNLGNGNFSGYSFYYYFSSFITGNTLNSFSGTAIGAIYEFTGKTDSNYDNVVIATIRSRGITNYSSTEHGPIYSLSGNTLKIDTTNSSQINSDPYGNFVLSGSTTENKNFTFNVSLKDTNSNYITNVLGTDNFGKPKSETPIFVEEHYPNLLNQMYKMGYIRGLKANLTYLNSARSGSVDSIGWYLEKYQSPETPYIVSELRGNKVYNLFKFLSISDGSSANTEVKVSIVNMSFKNRTFDVLVRSFYDSDSAPVVLEKYTNCTLDETTNSFIGKKIGTSDGEYNLVSKYIMIEMSSEYPNDALPCGFMGYQHRKYGSSRTPGPMYKTQYYYNNQAIYNQPFATSNIVTADNVKRTYLGFSTSLGYDNSFFSYKGKQNPTSIISDSTDWNVITKGFHMDSGASVVNIGNSYLSSVNNIYNVTNIGGAGAYLINGSSNPTLTLVEGQTYVFNINAPGHPFYINTANVTGTGSAYNNGVTNNGTDNGTITFTVPYNSPSTLYYNCQYHTTMRGVINVIDVPQAFNVGVSSFNSEPEDKTNAYYYLYARKFTLMFEGGFDGWDIYNEKRTNGDEYIIGGTGYMRGAKSVSGRYASATGQGTFKQIVEGDGTIDFATTDYYSYLKGILTYSNPESVNINVFVTPGIDYVNNSNLVEAAIDMVESDRADSIYITTTPDADLMDTNTKAYIYPQESIASLEESNIDSNYTATYYPWILVRDQVNNTQVYIPPTGEVCRNLALTDNVAFPWFASAGYSRGLVNSVKARLKLTQDERDILYQGRINPIATFSDVNTVIWGNKTLQVRESALNRLNVRRLLLQARKLISAVAVRLLFEQNDQIVRQQFLDTVNPILDGIRRDRGLTDFRVTVSSDPEDIDRNTMSGKIFIKPTRSLEFISLEFIITPTGASFEDI